MKQEIIRKKILKRILLAFMIVFISIGFIKYYEFKKYENSTVRNDGVILEEKGVKELVINILEKFDSRIEKNNIHFSSKNYKKKKYIGKDLIIGKSTYFVIIENDRTEYYVSWKKIDGKLDVYKIQEIIQNRYKTIFEKK